MFSFRDKTMIIARFSRKYLHILKLITRQRERRTIEYKEAWSELPGNLFETVCAFLNRDGGVIVLGAQDDGTITDGVNPRAIDQMLHTKLLILQASSKLVLLIIWRRTSV